VEIGIETRRDQLRQDRLRNATEECSRKRKISICRFNNEYIVKALSPGLMILPVDYVQPINLSILQSPYITHSFSTLTH